MKSFFLKRVGQNAKEKYCFFTAGISRQSGGKKQQQTHSLNYLNSHDCSLPKLPFQMSYGVKGAALHILICFSSPWLQMVAATQIPCSKGADLQKALIVTCVAEFNLLGSASVNNLFLLQSPESPRQTSEGASVAVSICVSHFSLGNCEIRLEVASQLHRKLQCIVT